jgi:hypothetical protein
VVISGETITKAWCRYKALLKVSRARILYYFSARTACSLK